MPATALAELEVSIQRLGVVLEPNGSDAEAEGTLNPACTRSPKGTLLLYPRDVAKGNISRVGLVRANAKGDDLEFERLGFALEPHAPYERRAHGGYGCEDPRVTFIPALDQYVMAYTAFGPSGPRIAIALSDDGFQWQRLGLLQFTRPGMHIGDDKDAAFFPEPVISPTGVKSLAFYHRPMLHLSAVDGRAAIPLIQQMPYEDRESIRIGYIPLAEALKDRRAMLNVVESVCVLVPVLEWGSLKLGAGTPPVRIKEGWMSVYHAVDVTDATGTKPRFVYRAGIMVHDAERPDIVRYRSPQPILSPETEAELRGIVDNVVFPTGIDVREDLGERIFDIYYGMADYKIGAARMTLGRSHDSGEPVESAA